MIFLNYVYIIGEHYHLLTKSEKKVADYILTTGKKIIYSTMSDVKQQTKVGDATIIRFCQKLGFSGFSDLKIEIAKEDFSSQKEQKKVDKFYDEILNSLKDVLDATTQLIDETELERAIQAISQASTIFIFGVGLSGNTGLDLETMFLRVGIHARAVIDPHIQAQVASLLDENAVVIIFSLSGKTKDTYDSLNIARSNGAKSIAITNYLNSPIGQLADIVLRTSVEEFLNGGSLAGKISQLYLCDLLVQGYERKNNVDSIALREKVLRAIIDKSID